MTRTTRDGVAKGRGRGKILRPRTPSSRMKRKSIRQLESDEYMSATESLSDLVITNGSITEVMQTYEESFLEDSAFKSPA